MKRSLVLVTLAAAVFSPALWADTFTVTNTDDSGVGSLRQAMLDANASAGVVDTIAFAIPGDGVQTIALLSVLPEVTDPVVIDGTTQGASPTPLIELNGTSAGGGGLTISAGGCTVKGLVINRFPGDGIVLMTNGGNIIQNVFIGTNADGTAARANGFTGLFIDAVSNNLIGGIVPSTRNVIAASGSFGIAIGGSAAANNRVEGNFLGTDVTGTIALGNFASGVALFNGARNNTIGGTVSGARNIISGNNFNGVGIVGGSADNLVQGNFIGTDITGTVSLANGTDGVALSGGVTGNTIGGTTPGAGNIISGNGLHGVEISDTDTTANLVQGNLIGTAANGSDSLGNVGDGIDFSSSDPASDNVIGGTLSGAGNLIAFNGDRGVFVGGGTGNAILGNSVFSHINLGIDIGDAGVTPNDDGDADAGANNLQNFPVLTSATLGGGQTTIVGTLNSASNTTFRVEFFGNAFPDPSGNGEGQGFLGSQDVTTDGSGEAAFTAVLPVLPPIGQLIAQTNISATATDPANNTSEFSSTVEAPITAGQLLNISTRIRVLTDDNVLIGGFIILGTDPKQVILRALGPSLGEAGVPDVLADPTLELHLSDGSIISNDNWKDSQQAEIEATGIPPTNDLESAIVATLVPGAYTAIVRGAGGGTGVGLVEAFDLDAAAGASANISARGFVDIGDNAMIGGFIIGSGGGGSATVVVRGIGPSLTAQGVPGALQDPTLELRSSNGVLLMSNDDWKESQQTEIEATGLAPTDDRESAILATLAPGGYTAIVRGAGGTTGVGLVETYNLQ